MCPCLLEYNASVREATGIHENEIVCRNHMHKQQIKYEYNMKAKKIIE